MDRTCPFVHLVNDSLLLGLPFNGSSHETGMKCGQLMNINLADTIIKWQMKKLRYSVVNSSWWEIFRVMYFEYFLHSFIYQICIENLHCAQHDADCQGYN